MGLGGRKKGREGGKRKSQIRAWEEVGPQAFIPAAYIQKSLLRRDNNLFCAPQDPTMPIVNLLLQKRYLSNESTQ